MLILIFSLLSVQTDETKSEPDVSRARVRISTIDADLERLGNKLDEMRRTGRRLSGEIGQLEIQRAILRGQIEKSRLELQEAEKGLEKNQEREIELEAQIADQRQVIGKRLRALYKRGSLGYSQLLLKQSQLAELIGAYHYAKILTERDQSTLRTFTETLAKLDQVRADLELIRAEAATAQEQLNTQKKELEKLLAERGRRLGEIRKQASQQKKLFEELDLEKQELHMMIRRFTESNFDPMDLRLPVTRYKGRLPWPGAGDLIRKFGVYRDPEFSTKRMINGINIYLPKGREVRTVYSGKVLYADWFKSYGNLVIIDHGDKVISFYAHCDRLLVKKGDFVDREAVIALSGDTGSLEGPMLHFEIRNKTIPEDPLTWLAPKK
ncbi:MAG: peptidoglycan DD-metalloendopeptidase family protein [Acidobacteriota bacterium]|nr:peptidoglycan DD-metalloendopeptidase family protein [Acidobacteriota bacterium]